MQISSLVTVCVLLRITTAHQQQQPTQNPCATKQTCHECIQAHICSWCYQRDYGNGTRCFQSNMNTDCAKEYIYNPDSIYNIIQNKRLQKASPSSVSESSSSPSSFSVHHEAVQISPQHVSLKLRINKPYRISLEYAQAEDYPVDLYYLMDLSYSMDDDKEKLSSLGDKLARRMQKITSNFTLGFGSFVDKVVMPFTSIELVMKTCSKCAVPYSFHNNMQLSFNTKRFAEKVRNAAVSGNIDLPEGGFDAIMQAVVCQKEIGWRKKTRRLLVLSTDADFHFAGDGKLGGVVKPNDGLCHLNDNGEYTHSTLQDYPSISQLNFAVQKSAINIIFAVTQEHISTYNKLSEHIEGSTAGELKEDSSNIIDVIQQEYDKISSSVEMKDNASSIVQVTYYSRCLNENGPLVQTNKCDGLKVGTKVMFQAEVVVKACPENKAEWNQIFEIYPVGLNESLIVNLEMLCDCPCEHKGDLNYIERAPECKGFGTFKCGVCECDHSHFGRSCECSSDSVNTNPGKDEDVTARCRPDNTTRVDCLGHGTCVCGQCECEEGRSGRFCECNDFSCLRYKGNLCAGSDHGTCVCEQCVCNSGWTGSACDCSTSNYTCIPPGGGEICSGYGECKCGKCECYKEEEASYSGYYCDKCPTCPGRCEELKHCVQCQVYKTGPLTEQECATNCTFVPIVVDVVQENEENEEILCPSYDENDCRFIFAYSYDAEGKTVVRSQQETECPAQVFLLKIVLVATGTTVVVGLAMLLLWKLLTTIYDRREFSKFEKERLTAKWDAMGNPIYKQAISTFNNPTYNGEE